MQMPRRFTMFLRLFVVGSSLAVVAGCGENDLPPMSQAAASPTTALVSTPAVSPPTQTVDGNPTETPDWQEISVGLPAIIPMLPVQVGVPSFTEQSVRDYIALYPPSHVDATQPITVKRVEFLPVEVVEERINHPVSVSRDALLCLVTIQGTWVLPAKFQAAGTPDPNAVMYLIFDAVTGNYIAKTSGIESD